MSSLLRGIRVFALLMLFVPAAFAQAGPTITTQPASGYVSLNGTTSFSVSATASSTLSYQWLFNNLTITGATSATLTLSNAQTSQEGNYSVVVTASGISVTSLPAQLTVVIPPTASSYTYTHIVPRGQSTSFYASYSGSSPVSIQWKFNGTAIPGANGSSYSISAVADANAGSYTYDVSNSAGSATSAGETLTVVDPIVITVQPAAQTVNAGDTITLSVTATGAGVLSYQWSTPGTYYPSTTSPTLTISNAQSVNAGNYSVTVSNNYQSVSSNSVTVVIKAPPSITGFSGSQVVAPNSFVSFSASAAGTGPLTYQWKKDGVNVPNTTPFSGTTSSYMYINPANAAQAGNYTLVVTNPYGSTTSAIAALSFTSAPVIDSNPASLTVVPGQTATFTVAATGTGTLTYQWRKDGVAIPGATAATLAIPSVSASSAGNYTVVVANTLGTATSSAAVLSVGTALTAPVITVQPASLSVNAGSAATFSVSATGNPAPQYQWRKGGVAIAGANGSTFTLPNVSISDGDNFSVVVSNSAGSVTSVNAVLSVSVSSHLLNLSARSFVGTDANVLITGFIIGGSCPKKLLIRASGPALSTFGVDGVLPNPILTLVGADGKTIASNDDWMVTSNLSELTAATASSGAYPFPANSKDAALVASLLPGAYTAVVSSSPSASSATGVSLVELFDLETNSAAELVNISARAYVGQGSQVLISGIIITGTAPKKILVRAIGPTLTNYGVPGVLADPKLSIVDSTGKTIAINDDWSVNDSLADLIATTAATGAFALPAGSKDSAMVVTLAPGAYTALVSGNNGGQGVALVELYRVP